MNRTLFGSLELLCAIGLCLGGGAIAFPQASLAQPLHLAQAAPSTSPPSIWKLFRPVGGGFSVLMPGEPVPMGASFQVQTVPLTLRQFVAAQQDDQVIYMAGWLDLPGDRLEGPTVASSLDSVREGFRSRLKGSVVQEFDLQLEGNPGRHFKLEALVGDRPYSITQRVYLKGNRLYQVTAMVPQTLESNLVQSVSGFLQSFRFVP